MPVVLSLLTSDEEGDGRDDDALDMPAGARTLEDAAFDVDEWVEAAAASAASVPNSSSQDSYYVSNTKRLPVDVEEWRAVEKSNEGLLRAYIEEYQRLKGNKTVQVNMAPSSTHSVRECLAYQRAARSVALCPTVISSIIDLKRLKNIDKGMATFGYRALCKAKGTCTSFSQELAVSPDRPPYSAPKVIEQDLDLGAEAKPRKRDRVPKYPLLRTGMAPVAKRSKPSSAAAAAEAEAAEAADAAIAQATATTHPSSTSSIVSSTSTNLQDYELVLIVDHREKANQQGNFFCNELQQANIPVEKRQLNLGDFLWILRKGDEEIVQGTIVERKIANDLAESLKDFRYKEQKMRMDRAPVTRRVYLVEGALKSQSVLPNIKSLKTAIWETRLSGYWVHEVNDRAETASFLINLHNSMAQTLANRDPESTKPVGIGISYSDFQDECKLHKSENVRDVYLHMLKQLPGCSGTVAKSIQNKYPTILNLMEAYLDPRLKVLDDPVGTMKNREALLASIRVDGAASRKVGIAMSTKCARVFASRLYMPVDEDEREQ